jgi:hypothetical protein
MLQEFYGSTGEGESDAAAFTKYRPVIERAASEKYDAGNAVSGEEKIVVRGEDVASHLSLKFGRR